MMKFSAVFVFFVVYVQAYDGGNDEMDGSKMTNFRVGESIDEYDDLDGSKLTNLRVGGGKSKDKSGSMRVSGGKSKDKSGSMRVSGGKSKSGNMRVNGKSKESSQMRLAGGNEGCGSEMFQLVNSKFPKMCLDGSKKRLALKPCGEPSAHNLFSVHRMGDSFLLKNNGECLSSTSLTKGPCESNIVKISRNGAFHVIHMGNNKCLNAKNQKQANMIKCGKKNKAQHFRFVPIFEAQATNSPASGMRYHLTESTNTGGLGINKGGFRVGSKKGN